jgi:lysophospholipase L1-like esterase
MTRVLSGRFAAVALGALASAALLVLFELGLRALGLPRFDACWDARYPFWQPEPDPELGWLFRPGTVVGSATINERGMRGPVLPAEKAPGRFRILFVGDSTCFGLHVALEETFAAIASRRLEVALPAQGIEYEIGALPGYSSWHSRVVTRRLLAQRPDLVVFYVGGHNDHSRARYYADGELPARLARRGAAWHRVRGLRLLENATDASYRHFLRKLRSMESAARVPPADFRTNVRDMLQRTRAAGALALVLSPPVSTLLLADHPIVPRYQEALREVAREEGALFADLHEAFGAGTEGGLLLDDGFHFSVQGHAVAGGVVAEAALASWRSGAFARR